MLLQAQSAVLGTKQRGNSSSQAAGDHGAEAIGRCQLITTTTKTKSISGGDTDGLFPLGPYWSYCPPLAGRCPMCTYTHATTPASPLWPSEGGMGRLSVTTYRRTVGRVRQMSMGLHLIEKVIQKTDDL